MNVSSDIAAFPVTEAAEMKRIFELQHAASRGEPAANLAKRRERLDKLRKLLVKNEGAFVRAISDDFGNRSAHETRLLEILTVTNAIRHSRKHVGHWMKPERRSVDMAFQPATAWVRFEPLGVVGIVAPWNYPLNLALAPLVDALAAGNRAMIKPSELTPRFSEVLRRVVAETYNEAEVAVVTGGPDVAQFFTGLPFDHLLFTGSTGVGRVVMKAASANLTPVTLELGGKSPAVLCADYPIDKAVDSIAFGKFLNSGQTCIAPDYALVPNDQVEAFAGAIVQRARQSYPTIAGNGDYTSIISQRHYDRLVAAIEEARAAGGTVLSYEDGGDATARKIAPTVVIGAPADGVLMREEIFGPILPVVGYDTLDQAVAIINGRDRPLALYCFTNDRHARDKVLDSTVSGGVTLNGTLLHMPQDSMPFGGVGPSGMGGYHGRDGFLRMSHARSTLKIGFINVFQKLGPPWGNLARRTGEILNKRR